MTLFRSGLCQDFMALWTSGEVHYLNLIERVNGDVFPVGRSK